MEFGACPPAGGLEIAAIGGYGAYLCASRPVVELLKTRARTLVYSTAPPPASIAAAIAALLDIIERRPDLVAQPLAKARAFTRALNLPLAQGTGDAGWLRAVGAGIGAIRRAGVDALVVSLGFDASIDEPLSFLAVSADGFARAGEAVRGLGVPVAVVQEGGYNLDVIGGLLVRFLGALGDGV